MKRKRIIILLSVILVILISLGVGGVISIKRKNINDCISLGMKYLTEGNYAESSRNFDRAIEMSPKNKEAIKLSLFSEDCQKIKKLYSEEDYAGVLEAIENIKNNEYYEYITDRISIISSDAEKKVESNDKMDSLDADIEKYISNKDYDKAMTLINDYLNKDLNKDELQKLNDLMEKVKQEKNNNGKNKKDEQKQDNKEQESKNDDKTNNQGNSVQQEYLKKLQELSDQVDSGYREKLYNCSTAESVNIATLRYNKWDEMLNEIWGVLKDTLPKEEMKSLTQVQLNWIAEKEKYEASALENKAGRATRYLMIDLNSALGDKTRDRCYELVNGYMK